MQQKHEFATRHYSLCAFVPHQNHRTLQQSHELPLHPLADVDIPSYHNLYNKLTQPQTPPSLTPRSQITSNFLLPTSYFLLPTSYSLLPTSNFQLPTSNFLLPTSYFLLPTSYFLLPTPYFLLPTSYSLLPSPQSARASRSCSKKHISICQIRPTKYLILYSFQPVTFCEPASKKVQSE